MLRGGSWHCAQEDTSGLLDWVNGVIVTAKGVSASTRPTPDTLEVRSEQIPGWAVVLAIVLFPIGLLFLTAKERKVMIVRMTRDEAGGSTMWVSGDATNAVANAMRYVHRETLSDPTITRA